MLRLIRTLLLVTAFIGLALIATVGALYLANGAPAVPALSAAETADSTKPYVVKLHARWCHYCFRQKDEWSRIEKAYAGRVNFVVLDFTTDAAWERSRAEAERLNLSAFFDDYAGATGAVVVLDGATKRVLAEVGGDQPFDDYRAAIDAALAR